MSPVLFTILTLAPAPAPVPEPAALAAATAALPGRPTVAEVQAAALRRLAVDPRVARGWLRRARAAAILPTLQGELDQSVVHDYQLDQAAGTADELSQDLGRGRGARARVTWELDRLLFNPDELRAARAALDADAERERILIVVTQLYFERLRLLLEIALLPPQGGEEAIARPLRIAEIEATLTGLTGLRF